MANSLYTHAKQSLLEGGIAWLTDTIKAALVKVAYTPDVANDQFFSTISANVVGTPVALASKTTTGGVADAADVTFTAVPGVNTINYIVIYKDTGTAATSPLIALIDTATNLPVTSNGGDLEVLWSSSSDRIFSL